MKNLVVPISIRLNSLADDSITIGLLAFNERNTFYDFSHEKLRLAKAFLDKESMIYLENALNALGKSFLSKKNNSELDFGDKILNEKYIDYLSKYSNGLLKIGEPKGFATFLDKHSFVKAFKSFVGTEPGKTIIKAPNSLRREMIKFLKKEAFESIDTNYTIEPKTIYGIYAPHKIDFIGINGSPYAGLAVDFTKDEDEVDKTILTFKHIAKGIADKACKVGMKPGTYELYFNEPDSKENRKILDLVRKDDSKGFKMIEFDRIDGVIKRLESGKFRKFSESEFVSI